MTPDRRAVLPLAVALLSLGACGGPGKAPAPKLYVLDAPPDQVFNHVMSLLADWDLLLGGSDRQTGVVSSEEYKIGRGDKFLGEGAGYWADCGKEMFLSRAASADEFRVKIQVKLEPAETGQTTVRIQTSMTAFESEALGSPTARCVSRGRLEEKLVRDLEARLAGSSSSSLSRVPDGRSGVKP